MKNTIITALAIATAISTYGAASLYDQVKQHEMDACVAAIFYLDSQVKGCRNHALPIWWTAKLGFKQITLQDNPSVEWK